MRKIPALFFMIFCVIHLQGQNTDELIRAEKAFEKSCLQLGIRDGFLAWVAPDGIEFTEKGPVNSKKLWSSFSSFPGIFSWAPSYAEMSISGNWGYTTGNYEHRAKSLNDAVDDAGQYTTVWHMNKKGEWKYLIDFGNKHEAVAPQKMARTISTGKFKATEYKDSLGLADLERIFTALFGKNIGDAYQRFGSSQYILNLPEHKLINGIDSATLIIEAFPTTPLYHSSGIFISPGGDMAAVYGSIENTAKTGSFLRIWRFEKTGWKIALEVIRI